MISPSVSDPAEDRSLRLPVHGNTMAAEDLKVRLVLAADLDEQMHIDASQVESLGQCVLQLLLAAHTEAQRQSLDFEITNPSPAFVERVVGCGLARMLSSDAGKDHS